MLTSVINKDSQRRVLDIVLNNDTLNNLSDQCCIVSGIPHRRYVETEEQDRLGDRKGKAIRASYTFPGAVGALFTISKVIAAFDRRRGRRKRWVASY